MFICWPIVGRFANCTYLFLSVQKRNRADIGFRLRFHGRWWWSDPNANIGKLRAAINLQTSYIRFQLVGLLFCLPDYYNYKFAFGVWASLGISLEEGFHFLLLIQSVIFENIKT